MATDAAADERPMLRYSWVITSEHPVSDLEINVPGVVFVDYDENLGRDPEVSASAASSDSDSDSAAPVAAATPQTPPPAGSKREIARVIVTSDSEELLEGLIVEPLETGSIARGLRVRVKNAEAELKGSIMTQVYVNTKNAVRLVDNATATTLIRDDILIRDDSTAEVTLWARNSGKLVVWAEEGFALGSLTASAQDGGLLEISAPYVVAQNTIAVSSWWNGGRADVVADTIAAKEVNALAFKSGDVILHTARLAAEKCFTGAGLSSVTQIRGSGAVREHTAMALWSSSASSPAVVTAKTEAFVGFASSVVAHPVKHLEAYNFGGSGFVAYVEAEPEIVRTDSYLTWLSRQSSAEPVAKLATPAMLAEAAQPRLLQEEVTREPAAFHMRVKRSKTPVLQNLEGSSYRAKQLADAVPMVGVLAVGALGVLNFRRRRLARLAKPAH